MASEHKHAMSSSAKQQPSTSSSSSSSLPPPIAERPQVGKSGSRILAHELPGDKAERHRREFVGLDALKQKQANTLESMQEWKSTSNWSEFHSSHYDWWLFPNDMESSQGLKYTLSEESVQDALKDDEFLLNLRQAVRLVAESWGWDVESGDVVPSPLESAQQRWTGHSIRLAKIGYCLRLFFGTSDSQWKSLTTFIDRIKINLDEELAHRSSWHFYHDAFDPED